MDTDRFERLVTGDAALTTLSAAWEIDLWGRILAFE